MEAQNICYRKKKKKSPRNAFSSSSLRRVAKIPSTHTVKRRKDLHRSPILFGAVVYSVPGILLSLSDRVRTVQY